MHAMPDDISVTTYRRLTYFPPGYPLIVSALLSLGLSVSAAVKLINVLALVAGFAGWMLLAGTLLPSRAARLVFALLLVVACRGTIPKGGTTDYVLWALLAWWLVALLGGVERKRMSWLVAAGAIVAFLIGFRWAAVALIGAGGLFILIDDLGPLPKRIVAAVAYGALPSLTFVAISAINRALSGGASSVLSYVQPSWHFSQLAAYYPFEGAFARPLAIEPLLTRLWRALDPSMGRSPWEVLFRLVVPLVLIALLMATSRGAERRFRRAAAITYLSVVGMLAVMTLRYNWTGTAWTYLEEPRYFLPFFPAVALFWLVTSEAIRNRSARVAWLLLLGVCIVYATQAEARWTAARLREGENDAPLLARMATIAHGERRSVVYDIDISRYVLRDSEQFSPRLYPDEATTARLYTTRPVDVWIVERTGQKTAYASDPDFDRKRLNALLAHFHPAPAWTSPDGRFRLYHSLVIPPSVAR